MLGVRVGVNDLDSLISSAMSAVIHRQPSFTFACANPHSLVHAQSDSDFYDALRACSAVVADGVGVTMAARLARVDVGPRITGADFFLGTMHALNRRGGRVFLFGSSEPVLARMTARARREYPNLHIDVLSPPYGSWSAEQNAAMVARIREARPDVLWVGMTAPKQEKWVRENIHGLDIPVVGSIGAVFDFYAETVQRAPAWMCAAGMEWVYRLAHEPRRLWKRTLISAPVFLALVCRERLLGVSANMSDATRASM